jgi:hypothetical protein
MDKGPKRVYSGVTAVFCAKICNACMRDMDEWITKHGIRASGTVRNLVWDEAAQYDQDGDREEEEEDGVDDEMEGEMGY